MTNIVLRSVKGSNITPTEADTDFKLGAQAKAANYGLLVSDNRDCVEFDGSDLTATLPKASLIVASADTGDYEVTIVNNNSTALTITPNGTDTILGANSSILIGQYQSVRLKVNQATDGWNLIGSAFDKSIFRGVLSKSANYTVTAADSSKLISCTSSPTITLVAAATAGDGFSIGISNDGSGSVTIDGNASETIFGDTTITLLPNECALIVCDGSNWVGITGKNPINAVSGYTRDSNGLYYLTAGITESPIVSNTTVSAPAGSQASEVVININTYARSANSIAERYGAITVWQDAAHTIKLATVEARAYEHTAITADNNLASCGAQLTVPLDGVEGSIYLVPTSDAGGNSLTYYSVLGYK